MPAAFAVTQCNACACRRARSELGRPPHAADLSRITWRSVRFSGGLPIPLFECRPHSHSQPMPRVVRDHRRLAIVNLKADRCLNVGFGGEAADRHDCADDRCIDRLNPPLKAVVSGMGNRRAVMGSAGAGCSAETADAPFLAVQHAWRIHRSAESVYAFL